MPVKSLRRLRNAWSRSSPKNCHRGESCSRNSTPGSIHQLPVPSPRPNAPVGAIVRSHSDHTRRSSAMNAYFAPKLTSAIPVVFAFCSGLRNRTGMSANIENRLENAYSKYGVTSW